MTENRHRDVNPPLSTAMYITLVRPIRKASPGFKLDENPISSPLSVAEGVVQLPHPVGDPGSVVILMFDGQSN